MKKSDGFLCAGRVFYPSFEDISMNFRKILSCAATIS